MNQRNDVGGSLGNSSTNANRPRQIRPAEQQLQRQQQQPQQQYQQQHVVLVHDQQILQQELARVAAARGQLQLEEERIRAYEQGLMFAANWHYANLQRTNQLITGSQTNGNQVQIVEPVQQANGQGRPSGNGNLTQRLLERSTPVLSQYSGQVPSSIQAQPVASTSNQARPSTSTGNGGQQRRESNSSGTASRNTADSGRDGRSLIDRTRRYQDNLAQAWMIPQPAGRTANTTTSGGVNVASNSGVQLPALNNADIVQHTQNAVNANVASEGSELAQRVRNAISSVQSSLPQTSSASLVTVRENASRDLENWTRQRRAAERASREEAAPSHTIYRDASPSHVTQGNPPRTGTMTMRPITQTVPSPPVPTARIEVISSPESQPAHVQPQERRTQQRIPSVVSWADVAQNLELPKIPEGNNSVLTPLLRPTMEHRIVYTQYRIVELMRRFPRPHSEDRFLEMLGEWARKTNFILPRTADYGRLYSAVNKLKQDEAKFSSSMARAVAIPPKALPPALMVHQLSAHLPPAVVTWSGPTNNHSNGPTNGVFRHAAVPGEGHAVSASEVTATVDSIASTNRVSSPTVVPNGMVPATANQQQASEKALPPARALLALLAREKKEVQPAPAQSLSGHEVDSPMSAQSSSLSNQDHLTPTSAQSSSTTSQHVLTPTFGQTAFISVHNPVTTPREGAWVIPPQIVGPAISEQELSDSASTPSECPVSIQEPRIAIIASEPAAPGDTFASTSSAPSAVHSIRTEVLQPTSEVQASIEEVITEEPVPPASDSGIASPSGLSHEPSVQEQSASSVDGQPAVSHDRQDPVELLAPTSEQVEIQLEEQVEKELEEPIIIRRAQTPDQAQDRPQDQDHDRAQSQAADQAEQIEVHRSKQRNALRKEIKALNVRPASPVVPQEETLNPYGVVNMRLIRSIPPNRMWVDIPVKKVPKPRPEPRPRSASPRHFNFWSPEFALDRFNKTCSSKVLSRTLLKRCNLRQCRWNGCDAELASEWHLQRHFETIHLPRAKLAKRHRDEVDAWACLWRDCSGFYASQEHLQQHVQTIHIHEGLKCPYTTCPRPDERYTNVGYLENHIARTPLLHDRRNVRPLMDLSIQLDHRFDVEVPREIHRADILPVKASRAVWQNARQKRNAINRVQDHSFIDREDRRMHAGENPPPIDMPMPAPAAVDDEEEEEEANGESVDSDTIVVKRESSLPAVVAKREQSLPYSLHQQQDPSKPKKSVLELEVVIEISRPNVEGN